MGEQIGDWLYVSRGTVAHWRPSPASRNGVLCGRTPAWFDPVGWHGTGSQAEYEKAAEMPRCKDCLRRGAAAH